MLSFNQFITEKVLNIGFNSDHEKFREQHRNQIHDIIQRSYSNVEGGYRGLGSGTEEESARIHQDISNMNIKAVKRDGKITAATLYKDKYGRKIVATGHDGSDQGRKDWKMVAKEDMTQKDRKTWGELSGGAEMAYSKLGGKEIPYEKVGQLTGKESQRVGDSNRYVRNVAGGAHEKVAIGNPKYEG